jgi:hypothetical protein
MNLQTELPYILSCIGLGMMIAGISVITLPGYHMLTINPDDWHMIGFAVGCSMIFSVIAFYTGLYLGDCLSDYEVDRQDIVEPQRPMYFREKQDNGKYQYVFSGMVYCSIHGCHMGRRARDEIAIESMRRGDTRKAKIMQ